jgi:rare lipoprotein A (peptidoglycan hydrolase)
MRKYFLTMCTLFVHTFTNNSKLFSSLEIIENTKEDNPKYVVKNEKNEDSTKIYFKKGGIHSATWYNPHGAKTASGESFHKDSLTAAYNFSKMSSYLRVTNILTNESVIVRVTDRMGYKGQNHIDLSKCAFDSIGNPRSGRIKVIVEEIK